MLTLEQVFLNLNKSITLYTPRTRATEYYSQRKSNLPEVELQFALLPMEQIVQNAYTLHWIIDRCIGIPSKTLHYNINKHKQMVSLTEKTVSLLWNLKLVWSKQDFCTCSSGY